MDAQDRAVVDSIKLRLVPLRTLEPDASDDDDLVPLGRLLDGARIVGLGESTHGVHEFFRVKHRLVQHLVRELGFTVIALEASYAACQPINDHVLQGRGERSTVLSGQHYLAWDTDELAALIDWVRHHNQSVDADQAVSFHGLDAGYNEVGRASVRDYLARLAPDRLPDVERLFDTMRVQEQRWPLATDEDVLAAAVAPLRELEEFLDADAARLARESSPAELDRNRWFVHVMNQWVEPGWPREQHLAENLVRVLESECPAAKAVLWLHNSHLAVEDEGGGGPRMGRRLRDRYGAAYRCVALEFGHGTFQTRRVDEDGTMGALVVTEMPPPPVRSLPWYLEQTGVPAFVLPLEDSSDRQADDWRRESLLEHGGMWIETDPSTLYEEVLAGEAYDAILFVDTITTSRPTPGAWTNAQNHVDF